MIKRFSWSNVLKVGLILFLIYLIVILSSLFVFSNKLTNVELAAVTDFYEEIRLTDETIKNDFYVDTILKIADKNIIYEELRRDALLYTLAVSENAFNIYMKDYKGADALAYLNRCKTDFNIFTGLESNVDLIDLHKSFFRADTKTVEDLNTFNNLMLEIVDEEYGYLEDVNTDRVNTVILWVISYVALVVGFSIIDFSCVFNRKEEKKK